MRQGEIINVTVTGINNEGEGVVRCGEEHFVLFIPNALPGEEISCRVVRVKKNYGTAKVLKRYNDSPDRVTPRCSHFGRCGGCQLQHLKYTAQLKLKRQTVFDSLQRIAGIAEPVVAECVPSPQEWGYRNKVSLPVQCGTTLQSGFYKPRSHDIVPFEKCPVLIPELETAATEVIHLLSEHNLSKTIDKNNFIKFIRHVVIRKAAYSREMLCAIIGSKNLGERDTEKLKSLVQKINLKINGLIYNKNNSEGNFIWGDDFTTVCGSQIIKEYLRDYKFEFEISSFFQINSEQAINIYDYAAKLALSDNPENVLELYSGVGSLTAFLASGAKKVVAVESWLPAAKYAKTNAVLNGHNNITAFTGRAEDIITTFTNEKFNVIVLDPPRTGCDAQVIDSIIKINPSKIVYVSCNPATMARDIKNLLAGGYSLAATVPFDMFPQTGHVESVCLMSRVKE